MYTLISLQNLSDPYWKTTSAALKSRRTVVARPSLGNSVYLTKQVKVVKHVFSAFSNKFLHLHNQFVGVDQRFQRSTKAQPKPPSASPHSLIDNKNLIERDELILLHVL